MWNIKSNNYFKTVLYLIFISLIVLVPFTGEVHLFDWDEINFAECAREMIMTHTYHTVLLNFQPFWEKPPLFIWMQILSMKLWGINEWAARFPNIINGIVTMCVLFYFGKKWYSVKFGWMWAIIHLASFLPHLYFRSGIIDPWYNLLALIGYLSVIEVFKRPSLKWVTIGAVSLGLSMLTKGPAIVGVIGSSVLIWLFFNKKYWDTKYLTYAMYYIFIFLMTGSSWFLFEYLSGNGHIIRAFIAYQIRLFQTEDSGHSGFLLYHFVVVLIGCFPASIIAISYFSRKITKDLHSQAMAILMWVVLIVFSIVKTKIIHYSSMSYYAVSFLSAYVFIQSNIIHRLQKISMVILGILIGLLLIVIAEIEYWKDWIIPFVKKTDVFAAENLKLNVKWYGIEFLSGVFLIVLIIWYVQIKNYRDAHHSTFFIGLIIWVSLTINGYTGKVEQYAQASAIYFFEFCGEHQYAVDTYGYKSYAHLFYGKRRPLNIQEQAKVDTQLQYLVDAGYDKISFYNIAYLNWLMRDKEVYPVFLVCKIQDEQELLKDKTFKKMYSRGGYSFFMKQKGHQ